jgi:hypothetical protein
MPYLNMKTLGKPPLEWLNMTCGVNKMMELNEVD